MDPYSDETISECLDSGFLGSELCWEELLSPPSLQNLDDIHFIECIGLHENSESNVEISEDLSIVEEYTKYQCDLNLKEKTYSNSNATSRQSNKKPRLPISSKNEQQSQGGCRNLLSERRRRQILNQKLLSLRSIVPNITKMDKVSIVADAITYIRNLQSDIVELEERISALHDNKITVCANKLPTNRVTKTADLEQKCCIMKVGISRMNQKTFMVTVFCRKGYNVMTRIMEAFDSIDGLLVINASIVNSDTSVVNTIFAEVTSWVSLKDEEIRCRIAKAASLFGLNVAPC